MISKKRKTSTFVILTRRQARALPVILSAKTIEEGCRNAGISKQTFYNWMKIDVFREEYRKNHSRFVALAMETIKGSAIEAAEKLSGMISSGEGALLRSVCKDIIAFNLKIREFDEIEPRIEELEEQFRKWDGRGKKDRSSHT
jgi:hypothetical protein